VKKILIVDDAVFMRKALRMILEQNGFEVVGEAGNGVEAIRMFGALSPDIVTMDITMPIMNGIDATKAIIESDPSARIVMISALGQEAYIKDAIISGATNFILKPFKGDTVVRTLNAV
jgi:two-component system chemotaxis response regulator CheY